MIQYDLDHLDTACLNTLRLMPWIATNALGRTTANALRHHSQVALLLKVTISLIADIPHSATTARYHTRWCHSDILQFN